MNRKEPSEWQRTQRNVLGLIEATALRIPTAPVPLWDLAQKRRVKEIRFQPLFGDGCVAVCNDGFIIFVDCDADDVDRLNRKWRDDVNAVGAWLGVRKRFSIAHEIAHTFFYRLDRERPEPLPGVQKPRNLKTLERTCQKTAGWLLMPEQLIKARIANENPVQPAALLAVARHFAVSPEALLWRLAEGDLWPNSFGGAALLTEHEGRLRVRKLVIDGTLKGFFKGIMGSLAKGENPDATKLIDKETFAIYGGDKKRLAEDVRLEDKKDGTVVVRPCEFACERVSRQPESYIVTIRSIDQAKFSFG